MPRYIDADYLLKELSFYADRPTKSAMKAIKEIALHPADVVEVVRCKDCKHWDGRSHKCNCSVNWGKSRPRKFENDYCSHAERKEKTDD